MAQRGVASEREVMRILTEIARSDTESAQTRLKAGELLGKAYGLFSDKGETEPAKPFEVNLRVLRGEGGGDGP